MPVTAVTGALTLYKVHWRVISTAKTAMLSVLHELNDNVDKNHAIVAYQYPFEYALAVTHLRSLDKDSIIQFFQQAIVCE